MRGFIVLNRHQIILISARPPRFLKVSGLYLVLSLPLSLRRGALEIFSQYPLTGGQRWAHTSEIQGHPIVIHFAISHRPTRGSISSL